MNLKEIKELIGIFNESNVTKLQIKKQDFEIQLDKASNVIAPAVSNVPVATSVPVVAPSTSSISAPTPIFAEGASCSVEGDFITSPMVGTFYHCPSPGANPFVKVGDTIKKGQTIGIVEAMKIMNEIEAECDCKILAIEANDGQPVEYGSKLVKIEKL